MGDEKRKEIITEAEVQEKLRSIGKEYIEQARHLELSLGKLTAIQKNEILEKMQCLIAHRNALLSISRKIRKTRRASLLPNIIRKG